MVLTKHWEGKHIAAIAAAGSLAVAVTYHDGPVWRAQVSVQAIGGTSIVFAVEVDADTFETKCPCRRREEFGDLCWHTLSLILKENLHPNDPRWYHESFRLSTYMELRELIPPEYKRGKGRPRKNRIESIVGLPTRICGACGELGHMTSTCRAPKTKFVVEMNWKKSISYAQQLVKLGIEE
jgi:hypothetical protein